MPSLLYMLRRAPESLSEALYCPFDSSSVVVSVVTQDSSVAADCAGRVLQGNESGVPVGKCLTYADLLSLIMQAEKVVVL